MRWTVSTPGQPLESQRSYYPAMQVDEILVWRAWLSLNQTAYERFDYNTRLGTDVDPGPNFPDNIRRAAIAIRSLRIDAVGWRSGQPTIFEVKRRAGPQNIGQLLTYKNLWVAQYPTGPEPQLVLVFKDMSQHILGVANASGIALAQVDVNFSTLAPKRLQ